MAKNTYNVDETLEVSTDLSSVKRSVKYVKSEKWKLLIALLINIVIVLLGLLVPIFTQIIIDDVLPVKNMHLLWIIALLYLVSLITSSVLGYIQAVLINRAGQNIIFKIREDLYAHLQRLPFSYFDDRPHGKILVRVVNYVNNVSNFLSNGLVGLVVQLLSVVFILIFMFSTNMELSFVIIAGLPLLVCVTVFLQPRTKKAFRNVNNKTSNLNAYLNESILGLKVSQGFSREKTNLEIQKKLAKNSRNAWISAIKLHFLTGPIIEVISMSVYCCVLLTGVLFFKDISLGVILAMAAYASRFWAPIMTLGNIYNEIINTTSYLERIYQVMDEPVIITDDVTSTDIQTIHGDVEYNDVTFSYDGSVNILENMSFKVTAGQSIALVGPTGAGKTTVVNLLSRFYDINGGDILIDGRNIKSITTNSLRSNMGIMLQDPFIFTGTIADNIRYGKLNATDEEITKAAKAAAAHDFIIEMPNGYDTHVSERGSSLSAGQKQLIAFARTIVSDPKILILDEATSSVDSETEMCLQDGIKSMISNRTSFIIAHRLSTIKNCDRIMYINNKGITESGTHNELMDKKGNYYNLYSSQQVFTS